MLPRFIKVESRMRELFSDLIFRYSHSASPIFSQIETYTIQEGRSSASVRGSRKRTFGMSEAVARSEIKFDDLKTFAEKDFMELARQVASQFLEKKTKDLIRSINKVTEETGNVVDNAGKPLTVDVLFDVLEKMDMDFDENEAPIFPSILIHPDMMDRIKQLATEAEQDPSIKLRHEHLIRRKREKFREREASRKLVG